ncbi:hypothetical protein [Tabrizicola sp. BL-A-41-H6]|uniref:hypothetical protein n=1 Tax=Tabrizicola sp. BL-A-41-H6 TaxID=3421107 RepID=UPI003D6725CF
MLHLRSLALVIAISCGGFSGALAQDRTERVAFAPGATGTSVSGTIRGERGVKYVLGASAAQRMSVDMTTSNPRSG